MVNQLNEEAQIHIAGITLMLLEVLDTFNIDTEDTYFVDKNGNEVSIQDSLVYMENLLGLTETYNVSTMQ